MRVFIFFAFFFSILACQTPLPAPPPMSASGVKEARVEVQVQSDGLTVEQQNIRDRLLMDNEPGSIKHMYVISAYSGDVLIYSTVKGKVTSSGKRLTPTTVAVGFAGTGNGSVASFGIPVTIGNMGGLMTSEVLQDDGSYGTSDPYLFWWDTRGVYHQHFLSGGQIVHISDQPLNVGKIVLNMELESP